MKITPGIINGEFIGTEGKIAESSHSGYIGISGKIVDESKNTFTFLQGGKMKRVIKEAAVFHFRFCDGSIVEIAGNLLVGRSEDRLKKSIKRLW